MGTIDKRDQTRRIAEIGAKEGMSVAPPFTLLFVSPILEDFDEEGRFADPCPLIIPLPANFDQSVMLIYPSAQRREVIAAEDVRSEFMHWAADDERVAGA